MVQQLRINLAKGLLNLHRPVDSLQNLVFLCAGLQQLGRRSFSLYIQIGSSSVIVSEGKLLDFIVGAQLHMAA